MKQITGHVHVKETDLCIPNLVVDVFDSSLSIADVLKQEASAQVLQRPGKYLSSVLTDEHGQFNLSTDDLEFSGNEPRPDLILVIRAPEDVQDVKRPFALPPEERILYISTPRVDVGAQAVYDIRLLQAQVDRFQLPTGPRGHDTHTAIQELSAPVIRALDIRDGVRARLAPKLLAEQKLVEEARQVAKQKLQHLSALPLHMRNEAAQKNALLIRGKAQLAQDLPRLQAKAIADGLARINKEELKPMRLRLTTEEIHELRLNVKGTKVSGEVLDKKLADIVPSFINVLDLVRVRNPEPPSLEELERRYLAPAITSEAKKASSKSKRTRKNA